MQTWQDDNTARTGVRTFARTSLALAAASLALAGGPAMAAGKGGSSSDGVILIDQARAEAGGVTADDLPGFPVTISAPGSYRLVGSIAVPDANTAAIEITSVNVTLDLGGFTIAGPTTCYTNAMTGTAVCTGTGTGSGIVIKPAGMNVTGSVAIRDGMIRGMGRYGVSNQSSMGGVHVERIMAIGNGSSGVGAQGGMTVVDSVLSFNGYNGAWGNSLYLLHNTIKGNGAYGVNAAGAIGALNVIQGNATNVYPGGMQSMGPNWCGGALCQ